MPKNPAESPSKSLSLRIHGAYDHLPEQERRIADVLLQYPGDLAAHTATELARRSGVSNATVTRFFKRLGFETFDAARQASRRLQMQGSPLHTASRATPGSEFLSAILQEEIAVLDSTLSALNPVTLRDIAETIGAARMVKIAGFRNSHALAQYLAAGLSQIRPNTSLMAAPAQSMAEDLAQLRAGDVAVFMGLRRRPAAFTDLVKVAAETGASVLLITDTSIRAAPAFARWTLTSTVQTSQAFDSYVGAMAILRAIVLSVATHSGEDNRGHLERVEALHDTLSDLE